VCVDLEKPTRRQWIFWFCLSLAFAGGFVWLALQQEFSTEYGLAEDARQHVFWMLRFTDAALFPNDLIADYFQSVAPAAYTALYQTMAGLGVDPLTVNKLLPIVLVPAVTVYSFGVCAELFPVPVAGFITSLLLNHSLIISDDLYSGTPRAFIYPLFLAFLYYLLRRSRLPCWGAIALLGGFYPQLMLVACGVLVLRLIDWRDWRPRLRGDRRDYWLSGIGLAIGGGMILLYALDSSGFGPVIAPSEAQKMVEFWGEGRATFFTHNPFDYWILGSRSGLLPHLDRILRPPLILTAFSLPWLLRQGDRFPLVARISPRLRILSDLLLASLGMFFAAHLFLFRLHHPSRYTMHSLRMVLTLAAGIALTLLLEFLYRWVVSRRGGLCRLLGGAMAIALIAWLLLYPALEPLKTISPLVSLLVPPDLLPGFVVAGNPPLYEFLQQQPKDSVIATLSTEGDDLPTFAQRPVLASRKYGLPYHTGYYRQIRERAIALIRAQYSLDPAIVQQTIAQYHISFWLLDQDAFTPGYFAARRWLRQFQPAAREAVITLEQGKAPIVQQAIARCTVFQTGNLILLRATCIP